MMRLVREHIAEHRRALNGHGCAQLPRENFVTRRSARFDSASFSISRHRAALWRCAARACLIVQRVGSSGFGHFKCGAEFLSQLKRLLCRWAKIAARVRPGLSKLDGVCPCEGRKRWVCGGFCSMRRCRLGCCCPNQELKFHGQLAVVQARQGWGRLERLIQPGLQITIYKELLAQQRQQIR